MSFMSPVIECRRLTKILNDHTLVENIHFQVKKGDCFGVFGPIKSGKTSLLKMMYCAWQPTHGELFVQGLNLRQNLKLIKKRIGVMPQVLGLDPDFNVLESLIVYSRYFGISKRKALTRSRELLRFVHLEEYDRRSVGHLTRGMQKRLALARALLHDPEIIKGSRSNFDRFNKKNSGGRKSLRPFVDSS